MPEIASQTFRVVGTAAFVASVNGAKNAAAQINVRDEIDRIAGAFAAAGDLPETTPDDVHAKEAAYVALQKRSEWQSAKWACDLPEKRAFLFLGLVLFLNRACHLPVVASDRCVGAIGDAGFELAEVEDTDQAVAILDVIVEKGEWHAARVPLDP